MLEMCKCSKWPVVRKCCFFVPIRKGVTIFGYVYLVLSLLSLPLLIFRLVKNLAEDAPSEDDLVDRTVHLPLGITFTSTDVVMTIILLIGAHKKKKLLLQIYFYFGVAFQLFTLFLDLAYFDYRQYGANMIYLVFLSLNVYLLFLVYNTVRLIEESRDVQYVACEQHRQST